ncbi:MAG: hypothetical protein RBR69_00475 [Candidatus Cloacimonadaceae bacterium]|jgi:predicted neutral ceramidase superfamily lipid hydrolase|nr:hypothetical protein [Candidatus Cloacimonadaceae bacterium]
MRKMLILALIVLMGTGLLSAQETSDNDDSVYYEETVNEDATTDVGVPNPPNKYLVLALSLFVIIVFYFLLLSHFPNLLAKGINPLTAAATQCLRFSLISAVVILLAIFAMSGFDFSYIGSTFTNNVGLIIFIAVVWLIYLTISISNKSKGAAK